MTERYSWNNGAYYGPLCFILELNLNGGGRWCAGKFCDGFLGKCYNCCDSDQNLSLWRIGAGHSSGNGWRPEKYEKPLLSATASH